MEDIKIEFKDDFTYCSNPLAQKAMNELLKQRMIAKLDKVYVNLSGSRRLGRVLRMNNKTCWVRIMIGARTYINIKRHIKKHKVRKSNGRI